MVAMKCTAIEVFHKSTQLKRGLLLSSQSLYLIYTLLGRRSAVPPSMPSLYLIDSNPFFAFFSALRKTLFSNFILILTSHLLAVVSLNKVKCNSCSCKYSIAPPTCRAHLAMQPRYQHHTCASIVTHSN
jgi:hypothetical protein